MANTYTQLNIHAIFAVKGRKNLLTGDFRPRLFEYISGALKGEDMYPLAVGGYTDHVHTFFELNPTKDISTIMQHIKQNATKWINNNRFVAEHFAWQAGYGAFSYSRSQRDNVIRYIMRQEEHHRKKTFKEEYLKMLKDFNMKYDEKYLFDFYP